MTYPNGRVLNYNYNSGLDNTISRLSSISDSSGTLEAYTYLGLSTVVKRAHPQSGVDLTYIAQSGQPTGDAGDQYIGLDRFGRVVDQRWLNTSTGAVADEFTYGYDQNSNVLYQDNLVNSAFSELYHANGATNGYDGLGRLTNFARGTLSISNGNTVPDTIASPTGSESWSLDALGNWASFTNGSTTQTRTANQQNEITSVSGATTPAYDMNGNTTTDQTGKTLIYDAWNRLVEVKSGSTVLEQYSYDALGRRITETPSGSPTKSLYYSSDWQVLEEDWSGATQVQYVWSAVYVDAMVERDRGSERLYALQDANWNVTALVNTSGVVQERYVYDPYGQVTILDPNWNVRSSSSFAWVYLHQGGRYDVATGWYSFRNRDYSPTLGRWMEVDPIGFTGGDVDLYRYVADDPVMADDPSGLAIYVIQGANTPVFPFTRIRNPANQAVHQDIAVDTWKKDCHKPINTGRSYYTFVMTGVGFWAGTNWLGLGTSWFCSWATGTVIDDTNDRKIGSGTVISLLQTTPDEDMEFKRRLDDMVGMQAGYSVVRHNCRMFAQWMFQIAVETYPQRGVIYAK